MAADHEHLVGGAGQGEPLVPGLVDRLGGACRRNARPQEGARLLPGVRPRHTLGSFGVAGLLAERLEIVDHTRWLEWHAPRIQRHSWCGNH